ncbi:14465_t:CDS:1 [Dentiscutata erythropus]|uniref:14465_t:CDS:1 n=1 Tax=Dentiscutata erythropus TaxID=1348616 RepID=A0A9N9E9L9_9GLOM|nr:14465_t:CDS:1 [Dentiscutata erythropus]
MPPPTQQQGQNSWLSRFTSLIITSSVVRYGTLIFLVALISVLYFATTHQVMKPSGANSAITSDILYISNSTTKDQFLKSNGNDSTISYDKGNVNQIGDYKSGNNKGILYDRGDGCLRYSDLNKSSVGIIPSVIPQDFKLRIGLVSSSSVRCSIDKKINNSISDLDIGLIIYPASLPDNNKYDNITDINLFVFAVEDSKLLDELKQLYNENQADNNQTKALRVTLTTAQPVPVNSWLFAMFAVGGILVTSFFISILIHMRLYRLRRNHQEEIRRQRTADDITGMRKWTLDQEDIDSLRVFTYSKKTAASRKSAEISTSAKMDENDNSVATNETDENSGDKSNGDVDAKESSTAPRSLSHKSSVRSTRSTRSTKSTRSQKAINNAVSLFTSTDSTQNPAVSDNDMALEETCAICLEDFDDGDKIRELPCHHYYHVECIDPWLTTKSSSCPLCKKDCKPSIGGGNNENTSISINIENERQATQSVTNQNSMNANNSNVVLRMGRLFRGYFSSRNGGTNSLENENGVELENVRSVN